MDKYILENPACYFKNSDKGILALTPGTTATTTTIQVGSTLSGSEFSQDLLSALPVISTSTESVSTSSLDANE